MKRNEEFVEGERVSCSFFHSIPTSGTYLMVKEVDFVLSPYLDNNSVRYRFLNKWVVVRGGRRESAVRTLFEKDRFTTDDFVEIGFVQPLDK